ncbi:MAG: hypothetical protein ACI8V2_003861 [Candidatus Latescibacterota bacterium]|jgi:hypothetical protein
MLFERYADRLENILIPQSQWQPYPTIQDRDAWASLPDAVKNAHIKAGEEALGYTWPSLPASLFLQFARNGNRSNYQDVRTARRNTLQNLIIAECLENKGRFLDDIANGIWTTCEETYWGVPAHLYMQEKGPGLPDIHDVTVDLFAAETLSLLTWATYLLGDTLDTVSDLIRPRILDEAQRRIITPCLERDDFWWMGIHNHPVLKEPRVNNWTPWICSNWLTGVLVLEKDPLRRIEAVDKILRCLDAFIDSYHSDGGCDEGPGYWGRAAASLFDNLELLQSATNGTIDVYTQSLIRNMGQFIYRAQIADDYFVNFADASAIVSPSASLTYRYGKAIGDPDMAAFGAWAAQKSNLGQSTLGDSLGRFLPAAFTLNDLLSTEPKIPLPRDVWLDGIQFFAARDTAGTGDGFYVAAKGGHNSESHNHNDVGNVIVYIDGKPVLVDAGVETYTAKTFSPKRYDIWTMQSAYHTVPTINGIQQLPGREFEASRVSYTLGEEQVDFFLDLVKAYPTEAGIKNWDRTISLIRGEEVTITDQFDLQAVMDEMSMHMITPCDVEIQNGTLALKETTFGKDRLTGTATVHYNTELFDVSVEKIPITDSRMNGVWGDHLNRITFTEKVRKLHDTWQFRITR